LKRDVQSSQRGGVRWSVSDGPTDTNRKTFPEAVKLRPSLPRGCLWESVTRKKREEMKAK